MTNYIFATNMKWLSLLIALFITFVSCNQSKDSISGNYKLTVENMKNVSSGELEIVGAGNDYFGKIVFHGKRERTFELGMQFQNRDSMYFSLPGNGGFVSLKAEDSNWKGKFKYFGLQADIIAQRIADPSEELKNLLSLRPLGEGIISSEKEESFPTYDSTNEILYFTRDQKLFSSHWNGSQWEVPIQLPFSKKYNDSAPYLFNKGSSLLFTSNRPIDSNESNKKNLWTVSRTANGWTEPSPLPHPINIDTLGDYHGAITSDANIYFISYNRKGGYGRSDIYHGKEDESGDYKVYNLGPQINSELSEADVYIDPNGDYILFASTGRSDSYGADDIYISFRGQVGWTTPINLGPEVNSYAYEYGPWVDNQNGYLYFNSYRRGKSDIYKVELNKIDAFKKYLN